VSEYRYKRDDFDIPTPALKLWNAADGKEKLDLLKVQFPKLNPADRGYGPAQTWRKFVANGLITVAFSPDAKLVAVGQGGETDTGKVHLLEAATGKLVRDVSGHQNGVTNVLFSADSKYLLSTGRDTTVRICQAADGKEAAVLGTPRGGQSKDWFSAVALSPDQRSVAATDISGLVQVWDIGG
jgi:WD40 repeat protein